MQEAKLRLDKMLDKSGECWLFTGSVNNKGYGQFWLNGRCRLPHRVAMELSTGEEPEGVVMHSCDTPLCCNPSHLSVGTQEENLQDMRNKRRASSPPHVAGELCGRAKLTWSQAALIRTDTRPQRVIAEEYGVTQPTVYKIQRGLTWQVQHQPKTDT